MKVLSLWSQTFSITYFFGKNGKASSLCELSLNRLILLFPIFVFNNEQKLCVQFNGEKKTTEVKKKKRKPFMFFVSVAFLQHLLSLVPHRYAAKSVSLKSSFVLCLKNLPQENRNLRLNDCWEGENFCLQLKSIKRFIFKPFHCK